MEDCERKYKEAFNMAVLEHKSDNEAVRESIERIFPQLKESEDEKIRKALISAINNICAGDEGLVNFNGFSKEQVLAWLEKQGKHANFRNKIQIGDKVTRNDNGELVNLSQLERVAKKLEKQEEQKPVEEYNITGIGSKNAQGKLGEMIKNLKPVNEVLEQKSADKVESKFNVGDWVVTSYGMVNQVIAVDEDGDGFALDDDTYLSGSWKDNFHLWTIQDARDGDVLVAKGEYFKEYIFIYSKMTDDDVISTHCGYDVIRNASNKTMSRFGRVEDFHSVCPATKGQRDQLEKAMADAGFTFDFDKKELKKIEQNPAWSEEDEIGLSDTLWAIKQAKTIAKDENDMGNLWYAEKWLESLKARVQPQPKQEWNEEDEYNFAFIQEALLGLDGDDSYREKCCKMAEWIDFIKAKISNFDDGYKVGFSAAKHNQWKPSDVQMKLLKEACDQHWEPDGLDPLYMLYQDLMKLKG